MVALAVGVFPNEFPPTMLLIMKRFLHSGERSDAFPQLRRSTFLYRAKQSDRTTGKPPGENADGDDVTRTDESERELTR